ncbi:Aste57867_19234 [Aphanomyces stellatus]|uniref:Aste57867_15751 protein n=1 Tax=Aphanomyces stellatus TaxID=120398 RepID=A0A485LCD0_9STRA|nr:hypothetical protein As57867_019170 [Aphanomyces stellatus]KAF0693274.1 hypothetical protein As57867_015695 [Aphanomyces stellatus]VFT92540.1 Aste57867_15751 [Aphanomyces stellatus]VFT95955.1 Aste57867_19234 [Aphanomyces stellatus]
MHMDKSAHSAAQHVWSVDLVEAVVRFISDPHDLLHFLAALEPTKCLGDLTHLLALVQQDDIDLDDVWPTLLITSWNVDDPAVRTVVKYYSNVELYGACDFTWLQVPLSTHVHLTTFSDCKMDEAAWRNWFNQFASVPITSMTWASNSNQAEVAFLDVLPRMGQLTGLVIAQPFSKTTRLVEIVSLSKLIRFEAWLCEVTIDSKTEYAHLTKWLLTQPVEVLCFNMRGLIQANADVSSAFFSALTRSTSLTKLDLEMLPLSHVHRFSFSLPPSLTTFCLSDVYFDDDPKFLADLVEYSTLDVLRITYSNMRSYFGEEDFRMFSNHLPKTLKVLDLSWCELSCGECKELAISLPSTSIVNLDISGNVVDDEGIGYLAQALQVSLLQQLIVNNSGVTETGLEDLIRTAKPGFYILFNMGDWDEDVKSRLCELAQQQKIRI